MAQSEAALFIVAVDGFVGRVIRYVNGNALPVYVSRLPFAATLNHQSSVPNPFERLLAT